MHDVRGLLFSIRCRKAWMSEAMHRAASTEYRQASVGMLESKGPLDRNQCILEVRTYKTWSPRRQLHDKALAEQAQEPDFTDLAPGKNQAREHRPEAPAHGEVRKTSRSWRLQGLTKPAQMARSRFSGKQCLKNIEQKGGKQWRKAAGADL